MSNTITAGGMEDLKARLKTTWMTGNYDRFARFLEPGAEDFFRRMPAQAGMKWLDVACGAGQLALIAARAGMETTGCDIATNWLEQARERASLEELKIRFEEGDAESLPYGEASFDVVSSMFGAMFAPRPELVAAEMLRVCRPAGMIVMANWTPVGFIGQMFKTIARYIAPAGMPSPVLWGDETVVRERFGAGVSELKMTRRLYPFVYPFGPEAVVQFFRENYGPMGRAFAALDAEGQAKLRNDLVELWSSYNKGQGDSTNVQSEYLEVHAVRA